MKERLNDSRYSWVPWLLGGLLLASIGVISWREIRLRSYNGLHRPGQRTVGDFSTLSTALKLYQMDTGQLPTQEQGLEALIRRPADLPKQARWRSMGDTLVRDPWENPYHYLRNDLLPGGFGIYSNGRDGISRTNGNDPDDVNTWRKREE